MKIRASEWVRPKAAFAVTRPFTTAEEVMPWFKWLSSRGNPCAIVRYRRYGVDYFQVLRILPEASIPYTPPDNITIVIEANGFSEVGRNSKGGNNAGR